MILIVSTCKYGLSEEEFVRPIAEIVEKAGIRYEIKHYKEKINPKEYDKAIICGTALKDFEYLENLERFEWINEFEGHILGICAGYQIIASMFGQKLERAERIGVYEVEVLRENPLAEGRFRAYFLHKLALKSVDVEPLAVQGDVVCMFQLRDLYGVSFHPEVLNPEIVERFLKI